MFRPVVVFAAVLLLLPYLAMAFYAQAVRRFARSLPMPVQLLVPATLCVPYLLVSCGAGHFALRWLAVYAIVPVVFAALLHGAAKSDPGQHGVWQDFLALALLGLAVDLRWLEPAWPHGLGVFNKVLLLDAGLYALLCNRRLEGVGFDLRVRASDLRWGLRELLFYAPIAMVLGLRVGFLHLHRGWPRPGQAAVAFGFTFLLIAVPEELFFRGWLQNLLMRRMAPRAALLVTAMVFGLAHWNKRTTSFNWQYVLLAALAGIFYGRAWRVERRVAASAITHAGVDTLWSLFLR